MHGLSVFAIAAQPERASTEWRPYGYGSSLQLDWRVGDGDLLDFGLVGAARIHDRSSFGSHGIMTLAAARQPFLNPRGIGNKPALTFDRAAASALIADSAASAFSGLNHPFTLAIFGRTDIATLNGTVFSLGHSTGQAALSIQWPRAAGSPGARLRAIHTSDAGVTVDRGTTAATTVTTSHRLLHITFDGSVIGGAIGTTSSTMSPIVWGTAAFSTVAPCTFDLLTIGCDRNASNVDGATPWSGAFRQIGLWNEVVPANDLAEWSEMAEAA